MRLEAVEIRREQRTGQASLFGAEEAGAFPGDADVKYTHEPPTPPYRSRPNADNDEPRSPGAS